MPSSLLDRLKSADSGPAEGSIATGDPEVDAVLRDLEWLFNSNSPMGLTPPSVLKRFPRVAASVMNYGLRNVFGKVLCDLSEIDRQVGFALASFEPRLSVTSQSVKLSGEGALVEIQIEGTLLTNHAARSLLIHTDLRTLNSKLDSNG